MPSSVSFGNLSTIGDKTVLTGSSSNIDSKSFIDGLVAAKSIPKDKLTTQVTAIDSESTKLAEMKTVLNTLQTSAALLRNNPVNSVTNTTNIFQARSVSLTSNTTVEGGTYLSVTANPGAAIGKYEVVTSQLARAQKDTSVAQASKTASIVTGATTIEVKDATAAVTATLNFNTGDSLNDIAAAFNAVKATTGVEANILQVSSSDFRLVLTSLSTGTENAFTLNFSVDPNNLENTLNFSSVAALNASFEVNDIAISRSSNKVTDVIEGVTLDLKQVTPNAGGPSETIVTVDVTNNTSIVETTLTDFVTAYNAYKIFDAEQRQRDAVTGAFLDTAILGENLTFRQAMEQLGKEVAKAVSGITAGDPDSFADIGITFVDQPASDSQVAIKNALKLNLDTLRTALGTDFNEVRKVFEFDFISDSPDLSVYERSNNIGTTAFTLAVDITAADRNEVAQVTYDPGSGNVTVNATYTSVIDRAISHNITTTSIFGSSATGTAFSSGITNGHRLRVTITNPDTTTSTQDFTYTAVSPNTATGQFNSLETLATAMNATAELTASVQNNRLIITATDEFDTLAFTNLDATDIKAGLNIEDTEILGGYISAFRPTQSSTGNNITSSAIFGASTSAAAFVGLTDGDAFSLQIKDTTGTTSGDFHTLVYKAAPVLSNEFNSLDTLATAINAQTGVGAAVTNNRLVVTAANPLHTLQFSNLSSTDFVTDVGLSNTVVQDLETSVLGGLEMLYTGDGTDSIAVTLTQGIADRVYYTADSFTKSNGLIDLDVTRLAEKKTSTQADITRWETRIADFRAQLVRQFAALEKAVSKVNSTLQLLQAQADARLSGAR